MPSALSPRTCSVDLACDPAAPRAARRLTELVLLQWGVSCSDTVDGALLVVSELVTNVLVHCDDAGALTLGLELEGAALTVWVADTAPLVPTQRQAQELAENGRGLAIVAQLAQHWDVEPQQVGKRVLAVLPVPSAACA